MTQYAIPRLHMRAFRAVSQMADAALTGCRWYMVMIHLQRVHLPVIGRVTGGAVIGGGDVVCGLARRAVVVVAAYAASQRLIVIHA